MIQFLVDQVDSISGDYRALKRELVQVVGYENGYGTGTFSVDSIGHDLISEAFLGCKVTVPVKELTVRRTRFGIDETVPIIFATDGFIELSIDSAPQVNVSLYCKSNGRGITLTGNVYSNEVVTQDISEQKIKLIADFLEMDIGRDGHITSHIRPPRSDRKSIAVLQSYVFFRWALDNEGLELEIVKPSAAPITGTLRNEKSSIDWKRLLNAFDILRQISDRNPLINASASFDEIVADGKALGVFESILSKNNMLATFDMIEPPLTSNVKHVLYYAFLVVDKFTFAVFAKRSVLRLDIENESHRIYMAECQLHRLFLFGSGTIDIQKIYEIEESSLDESVLSLGNISRFIS